MIGHEMESCSWMCMQLIIERFRAAQFKGQVSGEESEAVEREWA